jgi:hypothetical protein
MTDWWERFESRLERAAQRERDERHGRHLACGAIFDGITALMDSRNRTNAETRIFLDCRQVIADEMKKISDERKLDEEMTRVKVNREIAEAVERRVR